DVTYFFFQAEDGIRDSSVTGVQTCALPISSASLASDSQRTSATLCKARFNLRRSMANSMVFAMNTVQVASEASARPIITALTRRSEERRVGKGVKSRWTEVKEKE